MNIEVTPLAGVLLITPKIFHDARGFFMERVRHDQLEKNGATVRFVQLNHSHSIPGALRGLHGQKNPGQSKLVSCIRGKIFDVAVDVRSGSPTQGQWFGCELSPENGKSVFIPEGFLHGFCVLGNEPADVTYEVSGYYHAAGEYGARFDDPAFAIQWPIQNPKISDKDLAFTPWGQK